MPFTVNIFTASFDPQGFLALSIADNAPLMDAGRRVNVAPTLDGGVAVDDAGATDSDRSFTLTLRPKTQREAEQIKYLTISYPQLRAAFRDGCFQVVPLSVSFTGVECTWKLRVIARLA